LNKEIKSFFSIFSHSSKKSAKSLFTQSKGLNLSRSSKVISFFKFFKSFNHSFLSKPSTSPFCRFIDFGIKGGLDFGAFYPKAKFSSVFSICFLPLLPPKGSLNLSGSTKPSAKRFVF